MAEILYDDRNKKYNCPKVIILTHGDADGLVAALIVKAFEELNSQKAFLIMSSMDVSKEQTDKTLTYICDYNDLSTKDRIYILDRPLPSIEWLKMCYLSDIPTINIDHHLTNHPSMYKDLKCSENIDFYWDDKKSAAYLALEYFMQNTENISDKQKNLYEKLKDLAIATSCWDIFDWKNLGTSQKDIILKRKALSINSAEKILGTLGFFNTILTDMNNHKLNNEAFNETIFNFFDKLHKTYLLKVDSMYNFSTRIMYDIPYKKKKIAVIFGLDTNYQSIIADMIFEDKKYNYEIVAFLTMFGTVSLRSKGDNDVSELAYKIGEILGYSGGGHKNASGCKIINKEEIRDRMLTTFEECIKKI